MRHTGVALSALAVALTCGAGAAFGQRDFHQARDQRSKQYRDGDDRRDANEGYGVSGGYSNYGGHATRYAQSAYGYGGYGNGARVHDDNERVETYYRGDDEERFRRDDRRDVYRGDNEPDGR